MSTPRLSQLDAEALYRAVLTLEDEEDCRRFFSDLLTRQEIATFTQRLLVAQLLREGTTYEKIRARVSASSCTITRVNTELQFGEGGYHLVLDRMKEAERKTKE